MKTLMKPLMTERNSRNLCRRAKHQVRALVNLGMDKTPAQGVHEFGHEGFMMIEQVLPGWGALERTPGDEDVNTPGQRVHDSDHEPLMTAPRLVDVGERAVFLDPRPLAACHTAAGTLGVMGTSAATRFLDPS